MHGGHPKSSCEDWKRRARPEQLQKMLDGTSTRRKAKGSRTSRLQRSRTVRKSCERKRSTSAVEKDYIAHEEKLSEKETSSQYVDSNLAGQLKHCHRFLQLPDN